MLHGRQFVSQKSKILHKISPLRLRFLEIEPYVNSQFGTLSPIPRASRVLIWQTFRGNTGCMLLLHPLGAWYALGGCGFRERNGYGLCSQTASHQQVIWPFCASVVSSVQQG